MINFYWNRARYVNIVRTLDTELREVENAGDGEKREIITSSIRYMEKLTASVWIIALITGNLMCVHSAVQALFFHPDNPGQLSPPTILQSWFPFDEHRNHFWLIYAVQYFIMNIGMVIVPCWHSFIVSIMVFVIIKLKLLNHDLKNIDGNCDVQLAKCVSERAKVFDFVNELSSLISSSIFLDFITFAILLCALLFQATQVNACMTIRYESEWLIKLSPHRLPSESNWQSFSSTSSPWQPFCGCTIIMQMKLRSTWVAQSFWKSKPSITRQFTERPTDIVSLQVSVVQLLASISAAIVAVHVIVEADQDPCGIHRNEVGHFPGHFESFLQLLHTLNEHRFGLNHLRSEI